MRKDMKTLTDMVFSAIQAVRDDKGFASQAQQIFIGAKVLIDGYKLNLEAARLRHEDGIELNEPFFIGSSIKHPELPAQRVLPGGKAAK